MSFDCCGDPKPRVNDLDGTFFCASCGSQLSVDIDQRDGDAAPDSSTDAEDVGDQERENS